MRLHKAVLLFLPLFIFTQKVFSQSDWRNWYAMNVDASLSKKAELGFTHLRSYRLGDFVKNNFNESGIDFSYDVSKRLTAKVGFTLFQFPSSSITTKRLWLRGMYKTPIAGVINWSNGLQGELHSANEKRFHYRIIYQTFVSPRKRIGSLRLSPSISYWLYYNIGGDSIQYYNTAGSPISQLPADGIHRGRLKLNLNSKISQVFSISVYYLNNKEFNLTGNKMNVLNYSTGKISRPFNDYQVIGLSLNISAELYKKKSKRIRSTDKDNTL